MNNRIAAIQMTSTHVVKENLAAAKKLLSAAAANQAGLIVLPEMFATMGMDQAAKIKTREPAGSGLIQDFLREEAQRLKVWIVGGTIPIAVAGDAVRARAACLIFNDKGEEIARYDKIHLFDVELRATQESYSESSAIQPGDKVVVIDSPFGKLGLAVCYDVRFPELFRSMLKHGVEIIVMPTAFTYTTGMAHWDVLLRARAIENLSYVVAACQTGVHSNNRKTYGHSMIVNPWGEVMAALPDTAGVVAAEINLDWLHQLRQDFPVLLHRKL